MTRTPSLSSVGDTDMKCPLCDGTRKVQSKRVKVMRCPKCDGAGVVARFAYAAPAAPVVKIPRPTFGMPYHEKRLVAGRWVEVCPVCGHQTPTVRDPLDPEARRSSPETYAHIETHYEEPRS